MRYRAKNNWSRMCRRNSHLFPPRLNRKMPGPSSFYPFNTPHYTPFNPLSSRWFSFHFKTTNFACIFIILWCHLQLNNQTIISGTVGNSWTTVSFSFRSWEAQFMCSSDISGRRVILQLYIHNQFDCVKMGQW